VVQVVSYRDIEHTRFPRGVGWRTDMLGRASERPSADPQAFKVEAGSNSVLKSHFHAVDQFQIFIEGTGKLGRHAAQTITVHYADHHTGYGPIAAGPEGIAYLTLRNKTDSGLVYLDSPDVRAQLRPSRKRHRTSQPLATSLVPVLLGIREPSLVSVLETVEGDESIGAYIMRLGPGMSMTGPEASGTGGQYYVVLNGEMRRDGRDLTRYSLVFVAADEPPLQVEAGSNGLEILITQFPPFDEWIRQYG
jgi:hypothetical protein